MTVKRLHPAYQIAERLERAFTGDRETAHLRAAILVEELAQHGLLMNAEIASGDTVVVAPESVKEALEGALGAGYSTLPEGDPLNNKGTPSAPNQAATTGYQPLGAGMSAANPPIGGSSAMKRYESAFDIPLTFRRI